MTDPLEIGLTIKEIEATEVMTDQATMDLKYVDGVLHQKWIREYFTHGIDCDRVEEIWKPIPRE